MHIILCNGGFLLQSRNRHLDLHKFATSRDIVLHATRLIARLFRYSEGFAGSKTLPSKKVSLPRDVDFGTSTALASIVLAASRQRSSRLTLSTSALMSVEGSNLPQRISSATNQVAWLLNG